MVLPRIALNMIVKNEAHIIKETLDVVLPYIDYWVISDTGSTDGTQDIIRNFFIEHNIDGELHQDEWKDFGWNRTRALEHCKGKCEYAFVMDADDTIRGHIVFPEVMDADGYKIMIGPNTIYERVQFLKVSSNWVYKGVLHEYAVCTKPGAGLKKLEGDFMIISRRLGSRSKDPLKYLNDAKTLEKALKDEPDNERYMFYCAQSYFDSGDMINAIKYYQMRAKAGGWVQERYYSLYRIGQAMERLGKDPKEILEYYLQCDKLVSGRGEAGYSAAVLYDKIGESDKAIPLLERIMYLDADNRSGHLFYIKSIPVYIAGILLFSIIIRAKNYRKAANIASVLLERDIPDKERKELYQNYMNLLPIIKTSPGKCPKEWTKYLINPKRNLKFFVRRFRKKPHRILLAVGSKETLDMFIDRCEDVHLCGGVVSVGTKIDLPWIRHCKDWIDTLNYAKKNNLSYIVWIPGEYLTICPYAYLKCFEDPDIHFFNPIGRFSVDGKGEKLDLFPGIYKVSRMLTLNYKATLPFEEQIKKDAKVSSGNVLRVFRRAI